MKIKREKLMQIAQVDVRSVHEHHDIVFFDLGKENTAQV